MKCSTCQAEVADSQALFCPSCGSRLAAAQPTIEPGGEGNDGLDFVVTEAHDSEHEFVGGQRLGDAPDERPIRPEPDRPETPARPKPGSSDAGSVSLDDDEGPIGESEPPLPPTADYSDTDELAVETPATQAEEPAPPEVADNGIRKLSGEEVSEIRRKLYGSAGMPSPEESARTTTETKPGPQKTFGQGPIKPPKREAKELTPQEAAEVAADLEDSPKPTMAAHSRGLAYFYKNFIQLRGGHTLHDNDELTVAGRDYILRRKIINQKYVIGAGVGLVVLLLLIVSLQFIGYDGGQGRVAGVVLDDAGQLFIRGAEIRFPELSTTVKSDAEGFFQSNDIPTGTHRIEYVVDGKVIAADYATVVGGKLTMLTLFPSDENLAPDASEPIAGTPVKTSPPVQSAQQKPAPKPTTTASANTSRSGTSSKSKSSSSTRTKKYATLVLAANVEDARLKVDGEILGAGNLTYAKLAPGTHRYTASKEGFADKAGSIRLTADKTATLRVELEPLTMAAKKETYSADDFYHSGVEAYKAGDRQRAIDDFEAAVESQPSMAESYLALGEVYAASQQNDLAHDNFVRAGEIYRMRKDYNRGITAFNRAIDMNGHSIPARLGRGGVYLAKSEEIAAINDFEVVVDEDKNNFQGYMGLGQARFRQGYYDKAVKHFKSARGADPANPVAYQYLMLSYLADNDIKNVKKTFSKFKEIASPEDLGRFRNDPTYTAVVRIVD